MTPPLTPGQLLIIADEFARTHRVTVRSFAALAQAAAVSGARIEGIPVFVDVAEARAALEEAVRLAKPLSAHNDLFALVCGDVYLRFAATRR